jgi:hypothetical protein
MFIAKGGRPVRDRPHYLTLGPCRWLLKWYEDGLATLISVAASPAFGRAFLPASPDSQAPGITARTSTVKPDGALHQGVIGGADPADRAVDVVLEELLAERQTGVFDCRRRCGGSHPPQ